MEAFIRDTYNIGIKALFIFLYFGDKHKNTAEIIPLSNAYIILFSLLRLPLLTPSLCRDPVAVVPHLRKKLTGFTTFAQINSKELDMMKKIALLSGLFFLTLPLYGQSVLSDEAVISILTSTPSEEAVFTVYGHTAIRVKDPKRNIDAIFNYGIFDFSKSDFVYRFAKGETDYKLAAYDFGYYLADYRMRGSGVTEQALNLHQTEKQCIWDALLLNLEPQNSVYRYNFFFDNCATRPVAIVETQVEGEVVYHHATQPQTFRRLINHCMRNKPWLVFGCQLALGSPADRIATQHEELFLPLYLQAAFAEATIAEPDGSERRLVAQTRILSEAIPEEVSPVYVTPLACSLVLLASLLVITFMGWRSRRYCRAVDCILFALAGAGGIVLFFLAFVSVHPATWPNWSLVWLHPLHWVGVVCFAVKKCGKAAYYYHFINFAALALMLSGWCFIPQALHIAFIPLAACLWIRSGYGIYRYKSGIE
jgi:hypothetical protein